MRTFVVYHGNCPDGFTAAYAAWKKFQEEATYIPALYGDKAPEFPPDAEVFFLDFCFKRPVMEAIQKKVRSLTIIDHHKTAMEDMAGFSGNAVFDLTHSGCVLAWNFFHPNDIRPDFFDYVEDGDLWAFKLPRTKEFRAALRSYSQRFLVWDNLMHRVDDLKKEGVAVLKHQEAVVREIAKNVTWRYLGGYKVPVVNTAIYFSEVADFLCREHPTAPFAGYYFDRGDGKRQWGLRSEFGFDVSGIARLYGGGGHPNAAGFETHVPEMAFSADTVGVPS